jgi:iron complex outermembrane receptor protein
MLSLAVLFGDAADAAAIQGKVVAPSGVPVVGAEVVWVEGATPVRTDAFGHFRLPDSAAPRALVIRHPLFVEKTVPVDGTEAPLRIVLEPAPVFTESVLVLDRRLNEDAVPTGTAASTAVPDERPAPPATVLDVLAATPGVAENGQGGIFQNYSVRGLSRQRVLTQVAGMRLVGERRAGVSASFIDPLLLDSVSVVRGPATISYGSGALGGVVEVFPRAFEGADAAGGYVSQGNGSYLFGGWGGDGWSLAAAGRQAGDGEDPNGGTIDNGFEQVSATLRKTWMRGQVQYDLLAIPTVGRNIDKASTDYPARIVSYPEENHLFLRFAAKSETGWRVRAFVHPNDLVTQTERAGVVTSEVSNDAFDFGANAQWEFAPQRGPTSRVGVDWFGRRSVDAVETGSSPGQTLDGAREDEPSAFAMLEWGWHQLLFQAGARVAWNQQSNSGAALHEFGWNGFGGIVISLPKGFSITTQLATGSRFPSLSERFFSGTTGRGTAVGNPDLESETAVSAEAGFRWTGRRATTAFYAFRTRVSDFIDRVEIAPDVLTFANVREGTIGGLELEAYVQATGELRLTASAAAMRGDDGSGNPLEDIPANRATVGIEWNRAWFGLRAEGQWRASKDDPGVGEKAIPSASLLSAAATFALPRGVRIAVAGSNLLDDAYYPSADELVPLAPGRGFEVGVAWTWGGASSSPAP